MLREMGLAQYLKFCVRSKSMVLGTMERIFLKSLSHHLQLCKGHFRDLKEKSNSLGLWMFKYPL